MLIYVCLKSECETQRVDDGQVNRGGNPAPHDGAPERPRIAEHRAPSPDHQEEPDPQEEAGLGSPEPFQHSRRTLEKAHSSDSGAEPARLDASNSDVAGEADMSERRVGRNIQCSLTL